MSDATLKKIEKKLSKLIDQQDEIAARLERLEHRETSSAHSSPTTEETILFLDQFRAGEALGEASLGAWIEVCSTPCLKGGLRTVQMREGMHAVLLEQRIKELGGSCAFELPQAAQEAAMSGSADTTKTDAEKVLAFVSRFPDVDAALQPIYDLADRLDGDQETQALLRTIAQDERSTLDFLADACAQLNPS
jgi:hypothetical protein